MRKAALNAGKKIIREYERQEITVIKKEDDSPLTNADRIANEFIVKQLKSNFQNILVISEEGKNNSVEDLEEFFFLVDPLDGTKEFLKKTGEFTVNIGLICKKKAKLGVVYVPIKDKLYMTKSDKVSVCIDKASQSIDDQKISKLKTRKIPKSGSVIVTSASHSSAETIEYCSQFNPTKIISAGSSLKFCLIAEGQADYYPRLGRTMEWDTAAAHAILKGAGGNVFDLSNGSELLYGKKCFENQFFIANAVKR